MKDYLQYIKPEYGGIPKKRVFDDDKLYLATCRCGRGKVTVKGNHFNKNQPLVCAFCSYNTFHYRWKIEEVE